MPDHRNATCSHEPCIRTKSPIKGVYRFDVPTLVCGPAARVMFYEGLNRAREWLFMRAFDISDHLKSIYLAWIRPSDDEMPVLASEPRPCERPPRA